VDEGPYGLSSPDRLSKQFSEAFGFNRNVTMQLKRYFCSISSRQLNFFLTRAVCSFLACWSSAAAQDALQIRPSRIVVPSVPDPIESLGTIRVENSLLKTIEATKVSSEVVGRIGHFAVSEGDFVQQDQVIGNIDDRAVRLQQERSRVATEIAKIKQGSDIDLLLAEKRAAVAKNELERAEAANLRIAKTYPPKEIDRLRLVYDTALLEIERARHDQRLLQLEVDMMENDQRITDQLVERHRIVSPVSGMVVSVSKRRGEWVEPGTELLQIVNLDRLRIEGFVDAAVADRSLLQRSAQISVRAGAEEKVLRGKVVFLYPEINPVNNQMRVYLEIENSDGTLHPGLRVQATILPVDE
jgi:multidrug efflux pump subunit AcrA (membrane-fusion protein)